MLIVDDILIGVLTSAIVVLVDRKDQQIADKHKQALDELLNRAKRLQSPEERCRLMVNQSLRDEYAPDGVMYRVANLLACDTVLANDIVQWLLEANPNHFIERREELSQKLVPLTKCKKAQVEEFLNHLDDRMNDNLDLSQFRQDKKLNAIFRELQNSPDLTSIIKEHFRDLSVALQDLIKSNHISILHPICPEPKQPSKTNTLLSGNRPNDSDMNEDIDFRRTQFQPVLKSILEAEKFPTAFLFLADAQRGKTTFLKRVGWELASNGYPVLKLSTGGISEPYAEWVVNHAADLSTKPLVLLIDDPLSQSKEHFEGQMNVFHDRNTPVVVLIASRTEDWKNLNQDRSPLLHKAKKFDLSPDRYEAKKAIIKLKECNLITIEDNLIENLSEEVNGIPFTTGYFHEVIRVASRDEYKPMPVMIEEYLKKCNDPKTMDAFKLVYKYACIPGMVGLSLPESIFKELIPEEKRYLARNFCESMPIHPINFKGNALSTTHETHAEIGLADENITELLKSMIQTFVSLPKSCRFWGALLYLYRNRGMNKAVLLAWQSVSDQITETHWHECEPEYLTGCWGAFFYDNQIYDLALHVNKIAVSNAPDNASAHNNYALLLKELGEKDKAKEHYEETIRINPDNASAHNNYAVLLKESGEKDKAKEHYEEAIRINPDHAEAHYNYAVLLEELGEKDKAKEHYEETIRINSDHANAHYNYALMLQESGEKDKAKEHYEEVIRINPDHAEAHYNYALLLNELGEKDKAKKHYEEVIRINPDHAEAHANFANFMLDQGNINEALNLTIRAIRLKTLPDMGKRIPRWFSEHTDTLLQIVNSSNEPPVLRGGSLAFLIVIDSENAQELVTKWQNKPEFEEAAMICMEIFEIW